MCATEVVNSVRREPGVDLRRRLSEVVVAYLRYCRISGFTEMTRKTYAKELKWLVEWTGDSYVQDVDHWKLLTYLERYKERGLAPRTIAGRHGTLRAFFNWVVDWEILSESPMAKLKPLIWHSWWAGGGCGREYDQL